MKSCSKCVESGISYLDSKAERIDEAEDGHRLVACENGIVIPCSFRETFEVRPRSSSCSCTDSIWFGGNLFWFQNAVPFDQLKMKLMARWGKMGIKIAKVHEE
ncbi:hypothetical protein MKW92_042856, partial [Papaver armeniacum]